IAMFAARRAALYAVANRRSAERPATFASAKSRATSARMSSSSFFDARWRWTSWLPNNFVQVTLGSFHEFFGTSQNLREEMVLGRHFLSEFTCRIAGGVDLPSETALGLPKRRSEFSQADSADHEQVHVAERMFLTACHGTVDKGAVDTRLKRLKRLLESWQQPGGLFEETAQLGEQRRSCFGLEVGPRSFTALLQNPAVDKRLELPLQARRGRSEELCQLGQIPPFVRLRQRCGEQVPANRGKECRESRRL